MVKHGASPQKPKSYRPSEPMKNLIEEKLRLLEKDQSSRNWDAQKSKVLNKLFQSWADLIYFLESTAENIELQEVFEKDLKELFEVKPEHKVKQLSPLFGVELGGLRVQETAFARFVFASLIPHEDDSENSFSFGQSKSIRKPSFFSKIDNSFLLLCSHKPKDCS